jgi:hypothetical protein
LLFTNATCTTTPWCLYCLVQDQPLLDKVRAEIDEVLGPAMEEARAPTYEEIQQLELVRLCLAVGPPVRVDSP